MLLVTRWSLRVISSSSSNNPSCILLQQDRISARASAAELLEDLTLGIFLPIAPDTCENSKGMDVAFIVDKTKSLRKPNFLLLKGFLLELIAAMDIGPNATHTAIMTFSRKPDILSNFANTKFYSNEAVYQLIANIPDNLGTGTFIDRALLAAEDKFFNEEKGDRPKYPNVLVLFTDGKTNSKSKKFSEITPKLKVRSKHKLLAIYKISFNRYCQRQEVYIIIICNGNRTEWSLIRAVMIRVIKFAYHEYDYRPNWTTRSLITN